VHLEELDFWRRGEHDVPRNGTNVLFGEVLKLFLRFPHVRGTKAIGGPVYPVEHKPWSPGTPGTKAHPLDDLVVLVEGGPSEIELDGNRPC